MSISSPNPTESAYIRSIGQPVATGAGAIPARLRTPVPSTGRMRGKEMKKDEYRKLLLHPNWQKKRLEILSRDEFKCRACSDDSETLHVHHLFYVPGNSPWEYQNHTLVTLCSTCHEAEHESRREYETGLLEELRQIGFLSEEVGTIRNLVAQLHATKGHETARRVLMAVIDAVSWSLCQEGATDELVAVSDEFIQRQMVWLGSERICSQKIDGETP